MHDEVVEIYEKEEEINKIKDKLRQFNFEDLIKTKHFYYSIDEKNQDIETIKGKYKEFDRIKLIIKRKHLTNNKITYDFYYKLDDDSYFLYAIALDEPIPIILNAFHVQRSFKKFRQSLIKYYKKQFTHYSQGHE